jgi:hypothetical protein
MATAVLKLQKLVDNAVNKGLLGRTPAGRFAIEMEVGDMKKIEPLHQAAGLHLVIVLMVAIHLPNVVPSVDGLMVSAAL